MCDLVTDNSFRLEKTYEYILSIQVSLGGFSFSVVHPDEKRLLALKNKQLTISDDRFIARHMQEWLQSEEILQQTFKQTRLIILSEKFSLVPKEFFEKEKKRELIDCTLETKDNDIFVENWIEDFNTCLVFTLPSNLEDTIKQSTLLHPVKLLIDKRPQLSLGNGLILWFNAAGVYLILYNEDQLLLANHFKITHDNDVIYYVLTALNQLNTSPRKTELYLGGEIEQNGKLKKMLCNYFESVNFLNQDEEFIVDLEKFSQPLYPFILQFP